MMGKFNDERKQRDTRKIGKYFYIVCLFFMFFLPLYGSKMRVNAATSNLSNIPVTTSSGCNAQNVYTYTTFYCNFWDSTQSEKMTSVTALLKKDGRTVVSNTVYSQSSYFNWARIDFYVTESGSYTLSRSATTQTGTMTWNDMSVYIYPVSQCGATVQASSTNVSLSMTGTKSKTVTLKVKSDVANGRPRPNTVHYNINQSNTNVVSANWGDWYTSSDGYSAIDLTLTGKKGGEAYVTVSLREGNTDVEVNKTTINISVGPTYTVSYNGNGGSSSPSSQLKYYGDTLTLRSEKPVRTGYDFLGWSKNANAEAASFSPGGMYTDNSNATLYAVWKPYEYNVHYDLNGGSGSFPDQTKYYGRTLGLRTGTPSKTGYEFQGWSTGSSASSVEYKPGDNYYENSRVTLYAVWKLKEYVVSYNLNGGNGSFPNQIKYFGKMLTLRTGEPTKTAYDFLGWSVESSALRVDYKPGDSYTDNGNVTLYAVWKLQEYTVSYDLNGGSGSFPNQIKYYGKMLTLWTGEPTKTAYDFLGWSVESSASRVDYKPGDSYSNNSNVMLYAVWKEQFGQISECQITLSNNNYFYDGEDKKPLVTVKYNEKELKENEDYIVAYENNREAGTANVIILTSLLFFTSTPAISKY